MRRRLSPKQLQAAKKHLLAAHHVYAICHIMPDGDAVGSLLGLGRALTSLGKSCSLACADPIPFKFDFLPGVKDIVCAPPHSEEVIVTVDCSDIERLGSLYEETVFGSRPVINIDHHVTNTGFGTVQLVQSLPSAAEIVLALLRSLQVPLDRDMATALLTGLVTDTRCFRTGNVSSKQLRTAQMLIKAGASLTQITELVFSREPVSTVCLWGQSLANVQVRERIMWTEINREIMRRCGASPSDGNGLVSFLASRMGVDVAIVFRETADGRVEASMRSGPGWDISQVAFKLGGGGHPRAAGCTVTGGMDEVRDLVLNEIEAALREQEAGRGDPA